MIKITDKNRDEIMYNYIENLMDSMDWDTLYKYVKESLADKKELLDNESLEHEIMDYCPDLLKTDSE